MWQERRPKHHKRWTNLDKQLFPFTDFVLQHFCVLPWWGTCSAFVSLPEWHTFWFCYMPYTEAYVPIGHFPIGLATVSEFQCLWCNWQHMHKRHPENSSLPLGYDRYLYSIYSAVRRLLHCITFKQKDLQGFPFRSTKWIHKGFARLNMLGFFQDQSLNSCKEKMTFLLSCCKYIGKKNLSMFPHKHSTCLIFQAWKDLIAYCRPHITSSADLILLSCILQRTNIIKYIFIQNKLFHV